MGIIKKEFKLNKLEGVFNTLEATKKPFFIKDEKGELKQSKNEQGHDVFTIKPEKLKEAQEMLKKFDNELLIVGLEPFDEKALKRVLKKSIFDGIILAPLFEAGLLK